MRDHVATVAATLLYENKEQSPIEAVFVFPLPGDAAVCHFSAKIGQSEVVAEVREKQKVREELARQVSRFPKDTFVSLCQHSFEDLFCPRL